jgi:hypothetical protein
MSENIEISHLWILRKEIQDQFEAWLQAIGGKLAVDLYVELLNSWTYISWDNQILEGKPISPMADRLIKKTRCNLPALAKKFQSLIGNKWAQKQLWRKLFDSEVGKAQAIRRALVHLNLYPVNWIGNDKDFDWEEINNRAALHIIVNELPREELCAVFDLARLLLLEKDDGSGVENAKRKDAEFLEQYRKAHPDLILEE